MQSAFPLFIRDIYSTLRNSEIGDGERARLIHLIFSRTISFLGKLALLEYLQGECKSPFITYQILHSGYPSGPREWIRWFEEITSEYARQGIIPVLHPLLAVREKYSGFKYRESEDRVARLLWYDDLFLQGDYLVTSSDIQENEEQLAGFLEDLSFLETAEYKVEHDETVLVFGGKTLQLSPFYAARAENDKMSLDIGEDGPEALKKVYQIWIADDFEKYCKEAEGKFHFDAVTEVHRNYIMAPWVEIAVEESLKTLFTTIREIESENILLIEGYPATGKTALAANLPKYFPWVDRFFCYFLIPDTPLQECATLEKWLTGQLNAFFNLPDNGYSEANLKERLLHWLLNCRQAFARTSPNLVVVIDGVENMPVPEYLQLRRFMSLDPLDHIVFILLKRLQDLPEIGATHRIVLRCEDNVRFEESFTPVYAQSLAKRYLRHSPLAGEIFSYMAQRVEQFYSTVDIAESIAGFTPEILKVLLKMKPLCETKTVAACSEWDSLPIVQYRPFHPVCQNFFR